MKLSLFQLCLNWPFALAAAGMLLSFGPTLIAQQPVPGGSPQAIAGQEAKLGPAPSEAQGAADNEHGGGITEEELKRILVGKPLFLRGGYLDNSLSFGLHGDLQGKSLPASYTLCAVQIDKVHLSKRKVELVGARYGLHFLGALAYEEDPQKGVDRVKITPKKKALKITIDREVVVKPKKVKAPKHSGKKIGVDEALTADSGAVQARNVTKAETAAPGTTTSPAHSAMVLQAALEHIFAGSLDQSMIKAMPDFWQLYYRAATTKTDYRPSDPTVLRQNMVDQKAKLLTKFEPESNQFAQDHGVAGMSLYHVVIDADGKPGEIAVARPIGFGLDENAVFAIRTAKFEPAIKDGKPVPVMLDLVVQFRIFSKRTARNGSPERSGEAILPGPYTNLDPGEKQ
jgi:hypothetical protein